MKIAIAGASGCLGSTLLNKINTSKVVALYNNNKGLEKRNVQWVKADLLDRNLYKKLKGVKVLIYLVHSLNKWNYLDIDNKLANSTARAAKKAGVKKIIYMSGIIPRGEISEHLRSRYLTGKNLAKHVPVAEVRASILLATCSVSYKIVYYLSKRLPLMVTPKWLNSKCAPISIEDAADSILALTKRKILKHEIYEIGGEVIKYSDLLQRSGLAINGRRILLIPSGLFAIKLSALWLKLITGVNHRICMALAESLVCDTFPTNNRIKELIGRDAAPIDDTLRKLSRQMEKEEK